MAELMEVNRVVVLPWNCDQFGHMNVRWYAHHFDDGAFQLWPLIGINLNELLRTGIHTVVARTETSFRKETLAGDTLVIRGGFTRIGSKSVSMHLRMYDTNTDELCATYDAVEVFFDAGTRRTMAVPAEIRSRIESNLIDTASNDCC